MSKAYRDAAWRSKLKPERKVVLLYLAERADDDGICWPSMAMIAEACQITQRGAEKIVAAFLSEGLIERVSLGGGRGNPSRYRMLLKTPNSHQETPNEITPNTETPNAETANRIQTPNHETGFITETPNNKPGFRLVNPEPQDGVSGASEAETPNGEAENPEREVAHNKNNRHGTVMGERERARARPTVSSIYAATYGHDPPINGLERLSAVTDLEVWGEVMTAWKANGWRQNNFDAMAREYKARADRKAKTNGHASQTANSHLTAEKRDHIAAEVDRLAAGVRKLGASPKPKS